MSFVICIILSVSEILLKGRKYTFPMAIVLPSSRRVKRPS
jgi:hypothetical protein